MDRPDRGLPDPGRTHRPGPGRAALPPVHHPAPRRVLARHRLQKLCYEARLHTRSGRLPLVLWTRPTKVGERTWALCRAGICAEDFVAHSGELRAACYARDARVTRNRRCSQLVTIDIIRRDTLAASELITSPLARLTAHYHLDQLELVPPADPAKSRSPPPDQARRSRAPGPGTGRPNGPPLHSPTEAPIMTITTPGTPPPDRAGPGVPAVRVRPRAPGRRRVRLARLRQPGRTEHADRPRAQRRQVLRREPT